jgi:membrane-associated protein
MAGITSMKFGDFTLYNILGEIVWIGTYWLLGFFFGEIPWVKENYSLIFSGMILFLILGLLIGIFRTLILSLFVTIQHSTLS